MWFDDGMWFMRPLLTGVAICTQCGRTWELFRMRPEAAVCCGTLLTLLDDLNNETDPEPRPNGRTAAEGSDDQEAARFRS